MSANLPEEIPGEQLEVSNSHTTMDTSNPCLLERDVPPDESVNVEPTQADLGIPQTDLQSQHDPCISNTSTQDCLNPLYPNDSQHSTHSLAAVSVNLNPISGPDSQNIDDEIGKKITDLSSAAGTAFVGDVSAPVTIDGSVAVDEGIKISESDLNATMDTAVSLRATDDKNYVPQGADSSCAGIRLSHQDKAETLELCQSREPSTSEMQQTSGNMSQFDSETKFIGPVAPASHWTSIEAASTTAPPELMDVETTTMTVDGDKMPQIHWENYDFSNEAVPTFVTWAATEYLKNGAENFLRGCKWSPNGSQIVTNSNDNILRVFNMSEEITENEASSDLEQMSEVALRESGSVYDYAWHPGMTSGHPDTCRVATTCSGVPVHLWDSVTGKIVASYKAYDQYDEITSAYSLSFNPSGSRLFGGFKKAIRIFDTDYPGKKCQLVKTCGSKKSWSQPEQPGIISCFSHSPVSDGFFAAGSYTRHIGLYDLRCEGLTCVIEGQRGGITHLMFSPDGHRLFTGARKDNEILCWDMRHLGSIYFSALRDVRTNQRMYFDITRSGRYMTSGNDDGTVTFWDLSRSTEEINGRTYLKPVAQFEAHNDCVNGVSFHPSGNFLASASGQRHFRNFDKADSGSNSSDDDEETPIRDFSLKVWKMPLGKDAG